MQSSGDTADPIPVNLSESGVTTALRAFLLSILPPGVEVRLGQQNRVASPVGPFVLMTVIQRRQIATNGGRYTATGRIVTRQERVTVQISAFGAGAGDCIQRIATLFRDPYATDFFSAQLYPVAPLYAEEPRQVVFINGEDQYEDQWVSDLHLQANYEYTTPQQFADAATVDLIEVDTAHSESTA